MRSSINKCWGVHTLRSRRTRKHMFVNKKYKKDIKKNVVAYASERSRLHGKYKRRFEEV
jgi:hypothetical protein